MDGWMDGWMGDGRIGDGWMGDGRIGDGWTGWAMDGPVKKRQTDG